MTRIGVSSAVPRAIQAQWGVPMLARVHSAAILGVDAYPVQVEVDVSYNKESVNIVGLPDAAVRESVDRVEAAIRNSGFEFKQRITINLAPADIRASVGIDLPIALGLMSRRGRWGGWISTRSR